MDNNQNEYPSVEKPWLQYYSDEAINGKIPELTLYEYLLQNNKDSTDRIAINYLGNKITYRALFDNIHATAKGFVALGVKERDIVTIALPSVPEALYAVYALNMIGAVANMIHPLAGKSELISYLREVNSEVCVIFDKTYEIICDSLESTNVRRAIVVTVGNSMPLTMRALYNL